MTAPAVKELKEESDFSLFDQVPLFMRELPRADAGENDALEALRSLVYDGSPAGQ